ncbi:MAG TPA: helix-turn-helix domain-containing protein [Mobilitalea sp.]|nr:helix-turn-helix domain-containing protein [Mobilitalea sp.]
MNINERITKLEQDNSELRARVDILSRMEHYVTPAELAKILHCSKNHIYIQIRSGSIQAVTVGAAIRIPMSQFEPTKTPSKKTKRKQQNEVPAEKLSIQEIRNRVFA